MKEKAYKIEIHTVKGSRASTELSALVRTTSLKLAKDVATQIIEDKKHDYDEIKLVSVKKI